MASELIALSEDTLRCDDPRFSVCYARGSSFRKEGRFFRVEKGARNVVHRSLCLIHHYGSRCKICPHGSIVVELQVQQEDTP